MKTLALNPLVPLLPDAADKKHPGHDLTAAPLQGGDQLHLTARVLGFPKGQVLPVYGYCVLRDGQGRPYGITAYVRPVAMAHAVAFEARDYRVFPDAQNTERWFGAVLLYLVELDLTDYADCVRLERAPAAVAEALGYEVTLSQAA